MRDEETDPEVTPALLLRAYSVGIFPMAESARSSEIFWVNPEKRGTIPLNAFHVPRRLARSFRNGAFEICIDRDFAQVIRSCAERDETWINEDIVELYQGLFELGHAHSVEIWQEGELVGGLYGVTLGAAFFGESMFSHVRDASKHALIALVARLKAGGYLLLDTQFITGHLLKFGAVEISRSDYHKALNRALNHPADFMALPKDASRQELLQLSTQTS